MDHSIFRGPARNVDDQLGYDDPPSVLGNPFLDSDEEDGGLEEEEVAEDVPQSVQEECAGCHGPRQPRAALDCGCFNVCFLCAQVLVAQRGSCPNQHYLIP